MIYLASPYTHADPAVREERFRAVCRAAAELMRRGTLVLSPIAHSHPIAGFGLPTNWEFWERMDREHLKRCDELVVLMMDGWKESRGIQAEIRIARELGKPVRYLDPAAVTPPGGDGATTLAHVAKEADD